MEIKTIWTLLFSRLQPYLQIISHDSINAAKDILRSLRDDKEADVISEELARKGVCRPEDRTLDYLEYELSAHPIERTSKEQCTADFLIVHRQRI